MPDDLLREWEHLRELMSPTVNKQQLIDLKRTFFAGASAAIRVMGNPSKRAEDVLTEVVTEIHLFNNDVKQGRQ